MSAIVSMLVPIAGTFPGWPAADTPTPVQSLFVLLGVPGLVSLVIAVLVFAGRLARRGRGAQVRLEEPLWVGDTQTDEVTKAEGPRELTASGDEVDETGGASVRW